MADRRMRGVVGTLAMVSTSLVLFDCGSPAAGPSVQKVILSVRVLERGDELPIYMAAVRVNGVLVGGTDHGGSLHTPVTPGEALSVDVAAPQYLGFGADGSIANAETWTFYLEPAIGAQR